MSVWYLAFLDELMCTLIWCYVDMLVCFSWIVVQLPDQLPRFLACLPITIEKNENMKQYIRVDAEWLSGRMPDSRARKHRHESSYHRRIQGGGLGGTWPP